MKNAVFLSEKCEKNGGEKFLHQQKRRKENFVCTNETATKA